MIPFQNSQFHDLQLILYKIWLKIFSKKHCSCFTKRVFIHTTRQQNAKPTRTSRCKYMASTTFVEQEYIQSSGPLETLAEEGFSFTTVLFSPVPARVVG